MEDQAKNRNTTERQSAATPEEVVAAMALSELQELLQDLGMDSTAPTGRRLQQLVIQLHSFERAIEAMVGLPPWEPILNRKKEPSRRASELDRKT